jgi:hypothetical protein
MRVAVAAVLLTLGIGIQSEAQDTTRSRWRDQPPTGSAAVAVDVQYEIPGEKLPTAIEASALFAPFVTQHWQLGISPTMSYLSGGGPGGSYQAAAVMADYFPLARSASGPFAGGYLMEAGGSGSSYDAVGVQGGWLQFLTPQAALRGELRFRRYSVGLQRETYDVGMALEPYLFGRAAERLTTLPGLGTFDVSFSADYNFHPARTVTVDGTVAPFLTTWLQVGGTGHYVRYFEPVDSYHVLDAFARVYLPLSIRVLPFADGFVGDASSGVPGVTRGSHGARAGIRTYLVRSVSLDASMEWRTYEPILGNSSFVVRQLRVTLNTQLGRTR